MVDPEHQIEADEHIHLTMTICAPGRSFNCHMRVKCGSVFRFSLRMSDSSSSRHGAQRSGIPFPHAVTELRTRHSSLVNMGVSPFLLQENRNKPFSSETSRSETAQDIDGLEDCRQSILVCGVSYITI